VKLRRGVDYCTYAGIVSEVTQPRKRNAAQTRERILVVAYEAFAEHGYGSTGIREIAQRAQVASSLVLRYFGSKASLFHDAILFGIAKESMFVRDKAKFGALMAKMMAESGQTNLTAMMVLAIADPEAQDIARKALKRHVLAPLAEWLGPPHADARALTLYGIMSGFTIQMRMHDEGSVPPAAIKSLAKAMQDVVDGNY
jgi:AcrR family transcriptional regulator